MSKRKRKLTPAERRAKKKRREETMIIFINGKQKRVKRPPTTEGLPVDEFIGHNADPIWLQQNEMWELLDQPYAVPQAPVLEKATKSRSEPQTSADDDDLPF